jgi:secreted PhoX family phosphatase
MKDRRIGMRALVVGAAGTLAAATMALQGTAHAQPPVTNDLGFTPITSNALACSASGIMQFANDAHGNPLLPTVLMNAGDVATPVNAPASSNKVGRENDMIAISPDGKYLFTPSENANPSDTGAPNGSDGITRLTLKGPDAGKKEILADAVDGAGNNIWQRVDGIKWYGNGAKGVLLAGEEFGASALNGANGRVYFTVTEPAGDSNTRHGSAGQMVNRGGVYSFNTTGVPSLSTQSASLPYNALAPMIEVNDPVYANQAQAQGQQGLQFPDNLAFDGRGHLWVHEDIPDSTSAFPASGVDVSKQQRNQQDELYVYVLNKAGDQIVPNTDTTGPAISGGYKAADMRTSPAGVPCENEFTGGIFGQDGKTLYINQQHHDNPTVVVRIG